jgi:lipooligosaccharide transport system permease protein
MNALIDPLRAPRISARFIPVWRRNLLVWRKLAVPSILGNLADPMIYMVGLGYGLGRLLPDVGGMPYIAFLAAGTVCYSTMNSATFEALYSAYSRMAVQRTWDAIMNAPIDLDDLVLGELIWAASKSTLSGLAILVVVWLLGLSSSPLALWVLPLIFLVGLTFAALGLIVTAIAPSYDFFMYYFTLLITPMVLISGVFFPADQLPGAVRGVARALPLWHAVELARPLMSGTIPDGIPVHLAVLAGYLAVAYLVALALARRRLLS